MKKLALIVLGVHVSLLTFSQENFLSGYIIPTKNDTIRGLIDYRNWKGNPLQISFKENGSNEVRTITPADITTFAVLDEVYESAQVEIEVSSDKLADLSYDSQFKIEKDRVFLQAIVKGEKSLYYLMNKVGKDQFYIKRDSTYELLMYKQYFKTVNESKVAVKNKRYTIQLNDYLQDNPALREKINSAKYTRSSLEKLFALYYKNTGKSKEFEKKSEVSKWEIAAVAGVTLTSAEFSSSQKITNTDFGSSTNPVVGMSFDLVFPRGQRKWALTNELVYCSYELSGEYLDYANDNQYSITTMNFGASYLKLNTMVRFKYPVGKMFVLMNAGISNAYALSVTNEASKFEKFYLQEKTTEGPLVSDVRKYEQGISVGLGAGVKRISVLVRHEWSNGISAYANLKSSVGRTYFMISYRLK